MTTRGRRAWWLGLAITLVVAGLVSLAASSSPDGLEWVAERLGFADAATDHAAAGSPLADYAAPGAGVVGTLVVLALATGLFRLLGRRPSGNVP